MKKIDWDQLVEEKKEKKANTKNKDIPLDPKDIEIINYRENGDYKINSYNEKRLFLMLSDGDLLLQVFRNSSPNNIQLEDTDKDNDLELTKAEFCKNSLEIM